MQDIFHLSLSVSNLARSVDFYQTICGGRRGRETSDWTDIWLFGTQITLYERPDSIPPKNIQNGLHFGASVQWDKWHTIANTLKKFELNFARSPFVDDNTGVAKLVLRDPDGYLIELKAYREPSLSLGLDSLAS